MSGPNSTPPTGTNLDPTPPADPATNVDPAPPADPATNEDPAPPADPATNAAASALLRAIQQAASTATTPKGPTHQPPRPRMGGLNQLGPELFPWTGGKPNRGWLSLAASAPTTPKCPGQYRSFSVSQSQKSHHYRTQGLETPFKQTDDLPVFLEKIKSHFIDHGLDTITYVPDPLSPQNMISCIECHSRLSAKTFVTSTAAQLQLYDTYDTANDADATKFLLNSLDDPLAKEVRSVREKEDEPFPVILTYL